jgi:hypothetical protein
MSRLKFTLAGAFLFELSSPAFFGAIAHLVEQQTTILTNIGMFVVFVGRRLGIT